LFADYLFRGGEPARDSAGRTCSKSAGQSWRGRLQGSSRRWRIDVRQVRGLGRAVECTPSCFSSLATNFCLSGFEQVIISGLSSPEILSDDGFMKYANAIGLYAILVPFIYTWSFIWMNLVHTSASECTLEHLRPPTLVMETAMLMKSYVRHISVWTFRLTTIPSESRSSSL
jgi:hypothetical protein